MYVYIASAVLGIMGAVVIMKYGQAFGLVDIPSDRSSHARPTPKGGGVGILAAFIFVSVWVDVSFWLWGAVTVVALISLRGDKIDLSPGFRLIVHFCATIVVIWTGIMEDTVNLLLFQGNMVIAIFAVVVFLIFIVGTANIYNFMDGINGIAAITGIVGFSLLAWYSSKIEPEISVGIVCISLAFACLGFLPFNVPNAKVFMGDVGSILLGFVFAIMVVVLSNSAADFFALTASLFPFYADEFTTMIVRIKDGEMLSKPHRRHLYQLLANEMDIAHWKISLGYGLVQLFVGCSAIILIRYGFISIIGMLCSCFLVFALVSLYVRKIVTN